MIDFMVARGGIEPPTRGFSVRLSITNHLRNQSLAALANPHSSLFKAHFRHTQSGLGVITAQPHPRITGQNGRAFYRVRPCALRYPSLTHWDVSMIRHHPYKSAFESLLDIIVLVTRVQR
jgi:hypothetical protein